MKYTEDTLYDRLVGQYGFDPGDLDDFFRVNSKRNWLTYINKGETDIDRLADVIEDWLGYINPMDESTAKDIIKERNNMKLYEKDWPGEFSLKDNFSNSAYREFLDTLKNDYPELVPFFKDEDNYGYGSWFYEKAFDFYKENKGEINWENMDKFVKDFLETDGKSLIQNLKNLKKRDDNLNDARRTGKVNGKKVWHWDYEEDPDDGTRHQFKADGVNPVDGTYDGVYESTKLKEAIEILEQQGYRVVLNESTQIDEAINNPDEPASKKQLWALFCITKKDWRDKNLTKGEASELIQKYSGERTTQNKEALSTNSIKKDIIQNLKPKLDKQMAKAFGMQSVVGDADLEGNLIPGRKRYKFFGSGCGWAWVKYDKRNKKLGEVLDKYDDVYRKVFFEKFANEYIKKYKERELGAVLSQDIDIQCIIKQAALDYAESIGINTKGAYVNSRLD